MLETALYQATEMENLDQVLTLIKNKADPNIPQYDGLIPLHKAVERQNIQLVEELLAFGSNPNHQNNYYFQTPVHYAIKYNVKAAILLLLVQYGGKLWIRDKDKKRPIDYVESNEMMETIAMLKVKREDAFKTPSKCSSFSDKKLIQTEKSLKNPVIEEIKEMDENKCTALFENNSFTLDNRLESFLTNNIYSDRTNKYIYNLK